MANDMEKHSNEEIHFHASQQLLDMIEVIRGVVAKEWMSIPHEITDYSKHNKESIEKGVTLHCAYRNQRCVIAWPSCVKKCLQNYEKVIKNEVRSGVIEIFNNHIVTYPTNE